jgi:hypothetical protein
MLRTEGEEAVKSLQIRTSCELEEREEVRTKVKVGVKEA